VSVRRKKCSGTVNDSLRGEETKMTSHSSDDDRTKEEKLLPRKTDMPFIDRMVRGVISFMYLVGMLIWGIVGAPFWIVGICLALVFILFITIARAFTARNFTVDRRVLRNVIRFYPDGFRMLKSDYAKIDTILDDEHDAPPEVSYVFSTIQTICLLLIFSLLWCLYRNIEILSISPNIFLGAAIIVALAIFMAFSYDKRRSNSVISSIETNTQMLRSPIAATQNPISADDAAPTGGKGTPKDLK